MSAQQKSPIIHHPSSHTHVVAQRELYRTFLSELTTNPQDGLHDDDERRRLGEADSERQASYFTWPYVPLLSAPTSRDLRSSCSS